MSSLKTVRRLASSELKVGESRVWIDPEQIDRLVNVISREEVRRLIKDGVIKKRPTSKPSRGRARLLHEKKKKGRRRGHGSKKGPRRDEKREWINRIRAQRRFLKALREKDLIDAKTYRRLYRLAKGGFFRNLAHLKLYINEHKLLKQGEASD